MLAQYGQRVQRPQKSTQVILKTLDFNKPFTSHQCFKKSIGAVLSQHFNEDGERPIIFFTKKLKAAQACYTVMGKECLVVIAVINHFTVMG